MIFPSVPASPYPSVTSPDPVLCPTPSVHSESNPDDFPSFHVHSRNSEHTTIKQEDVVSHRDVILTGPSSPQIDDEDYEDPKGEAVAPMTMTPGTTSTPMTPMTPMTPTTPDSLSDLSRPASSQFSFSTNLNSSLSSAPTGIYSPTTSCQLFKVRLYFQERPSEISLILPVVEFLFHSVNLCFLFSTSFLEAGYDREL